MGAHHGQPAQCFVTESLDLIGQSLNGFGRAARLVAAEERAAPMRMDEAAFMAAAMARQISTDLGAHHRKLDSMAVFILDPFACTALASRLDAVDVRISIKLSARPAFAATAVRFHFPSHFQAFSACRFLLHLSWPP
jgi:hypothetical protein